MTSIAIAQIAKKVITPASGSQRRHPVWRPDTLPSAAGSGTPGSMSCDTAPEKATGSASDVTGNRPAVGAASGEAEGRPAAGAASGASAPEGAAGGVDE